MRYVRLCLISIFVLIPSAAIAELIEGLCDGSANEDVTCDTETGLEWLDLGRSRGLSINQFRSDPQFTGWSVATGEAVDQLLLNAGFPSLPGAIVFPAPDPWERPDDLHYLLLDLFDNTLVFMNMSGGAGWAINGPNLASAPHFFTAPSFMPEDAFSAARGSEYVCCSDFDASWPFDLAEPFWFTDIAVWANRGSLTVDIAPGSYPNSINLKSKGIIPVAVLTTDTFDATQIDWETVIFGPGGATESHDRSHVQDVDGDGDMDVVFHFNTQDSGIACDDTDATLTGETFGGVTVTGSDSVKIVKCP
jgi:hypothetical protein